VKICVTLTDETTAAVAGRMAELQSVADLFEVRADFVRDLDLPALLRARTKPVLLTCRSEAEGGRSSAVDAPRRRRLLADAVSLGFDLVDVEGSSGFDEIVKARSGRGIVLSLHDFERTPDDLDASYERLAAARPEVVKIVVSARSIADLGRVLAFARRRAKARNQNPATPQLVTFAMGPEGVASRILGGRYGAPFTFAAPANGLEAAPGQLSARTLAETYRVRTIGPGTRVYGVLGSDVLRSLSPAIHNRAFAELGLDAVYVPLQAGSFDAFLQALPDLELSGFSITRPYKQAILPHLVSCDAEAARAGSVNTVSVREGGTLAGCSTDGEGVLEPLRRRQDVAGRRVALVGGGGAARAAALALRCAGARVTVLARRIEQAADVAAATGSEHAALDRLDALDWDVLLNATPVGSGAARGQMPVPAGSLRPGRVVFDMVYEPRDTPLLAAARARGCETIEGVEMLVAQAAGQLAFWTGAEPPLAAMTEAALAALVEARA
jgi:3-dehydroquinate dehydratase/shikimate dehydrogenase